MASWFGWLAALVLVLAPALPARASEAVDVALVLLADGSGSIDPEELRLQREGYALGLASKPVQDAIRAGAHGRVAVAFVEWGAPASQDLVVDWTVIHDEASAKAFAARLLAAPKKSYGYNSISNAIDFAMQLFARAPVRPEQRVIDVSADGPNIGGRPITAARDEAVGQGVTINGLVVRNPGSATAWGGSISLEEYFRANVVGGPGHFVEVAEGRERFAEAVRRKLIQELASADIARRILAAGGMPPVSAR